MIIKPGVLWEIMSSIEVTPRTWQKLGQEGGGAPKRESLDGAEDPSVHSLQVQELGLGNTLETHKVLWGFFFVGGSGHETHNAGICEGSATTEISYTLG